MNRTILLMLLVAAAVLAGCETPSIHPLFSEDKRITDAALIGRWEADDDDLYLISAEDDHYRLVVEDRAKNLQMWNLEVWPIQLGKHRFADLRAANKEQRTVEEKWASFFVATHMFVRYTVDTGAGSLKLWILKGDWFSKQRVRPSYTSFDYLPIDPGDQRYLLTADTSELQAFLQSHADDPDAFRMEELKRLKP